MSSIHCTATLSKIGSRLILVLPQSASAKLPSRGMTMVEGTINGAPFKVALEPDGRGSHWFRVDKPKLKVGDTVTLEIKPTQDWVEPEVPADLKKALSAVPQANALWKEITPSARWDWIRWIRSTKQAEIRRKRIMIACDKLKAKKRRPCCFNRNMCTEPEVSHNGMLIELKIAKKK